MAIGNSISSGQLHMADPKLWCFSDDKFVPFHTPTERCQNILRAFCKDSKRCKYDKSTKKFTKNKGDLHKRCWTDFVLGIQPFFSFFSPHRKSSTFSYFHLVHFYASDVKGRHIFMHSFIPV